MNRRDVMTIPKLSADEYSDIVTEHNRRIRRGQIGARPRAGCVHRLLQRGRLGPAHRSVPVVRRHLPLCSRVLNVAGLIGCLILVVTLPWTSIVAGLAMFAVGLGGRAIAMQKRGEAIAG